MPFTPTAPTSPGQNPQAFKAFSGANITAVIGNRIVGTLQALTCSITREVGAIYSFGEASPRAFVKGKRGIAGSMVFTQFDRHPLLQDIFLGAFDKPLSTANELFQSRFLDITNNQSLLGGDSFKTRNFEAAGSIGGSLPRDTADNLKTELQDLYTLVANQKLRYTDQLPEFDVVVSFVNDVGDAAFLVVGGIQLVNEGWGWSLDDLTSETAMTYVAKVVTPLTALTGGLATATPLTLRFDNGTGGSPFVRPQ